MQPVYIVDGARTPLLRAEGKPGPFAALDLATYASQGVLKRLPIQATDIDEVILGCIVPSHDEANIGRLLALRVGCGDTVPGWTVQRNCGSGMQAIDCAYKDILLGRADLILTGGTEAMSRAPLEFNGSAVDWFSEMARNRSFTEKLRTLLKWRPTMLSPVISLLHGLRDPIIQLGMGETAEILAYEFNLSREQLDAYALRSQQRLARAFDNHYFQEELIPIYDHEGNVYKIDTGLRRDTSPEKLAKLKPVFDKKFGKVTAGNSSQVTDGAAVLILASEKAVKKFNLPTLGKIVDVNWGALSPRTMGLGPVFASTPLLLKHNLTFADIDYWEINEAFSAQVLADIAAWESPQFCQHFFNLDHSFGTLDQAKLNIDGGAIAMGHPVGASGARIVLHALNVLKRENKQRAMAAICIGGGQGGAMLLERE